MKSITLLVALSTLLQSTFAHYRFQTLLTTPPSAPYTYIRPNTNHNTPITALSSPDLRCNTGTTPAGPRTSTLTIPAGSPLTIALDQQIFHAGPLLAYISPAPTGSNVSTYDGSGAWTKIAQLGPLCDGASACDWRRTQVAEYTVRIPARTPAGEYLLRVEHVALHNAGLKGGVEFYMSCAQIRVEGPGGGRLGDGVRFPGAYGAGDRGLLVDIYYPVLMEYEMPGPEVWDGL